MVCLTSGHCLFLLGHLITKQGRKEGLYFSVCKGHKNPDSLGSQVWNKIASWGLRIFTYIISCNNSSSSSSLFIPLCHLRPLFQHLVYWLYRIGTPAAYSCKSEQLQFVVPYGETVVSSVLPLMAVEYYFLGGDEFNRYMNEILPSSREYFWPKHIDLVPSVKRSLLEVDHDSKPCELRNYVHPLPEKLLQFDNTPKGNLSDSFLKLCDTNASILNDSYIRNGQEQDVIDLNQNLWINSFSNIGHMKQKLPQAGDFAGLVPCPPSYISSCSGNHHHPNLFASTSVVPSSVNLPRPTDNTMKCRIYDDEVRTDQPFAERISSGYSHVQQSSDSPSNSSNKTSTFRKDVWRKNKHPKPTHASDDEVAKKPRVVPQSSCPTLKVRKEKLGDRIAALHRMVSPFGKTDTASVLTEAIGYIQFLQDQIQRLSMTYLKSSCSSSCPTTRGGRLSMKEQKDEEERERQDLKSRGLCLVPLAFTSYVFSYNGSIC